MATRRTRGREKVTLSDRLKLWAEQVRADAKKLPPGPDRDALLEKARQADTATHLNERASTNGTEPPK
jgi:hypothetical protein